MGISSDFLYMICVFLFFFLAYVIIRYIYFLITGVLLYHKVKKIRKLITDVHDPDRYIERIDKLLLRHKKNKQLRIYLLLCKNIGLNYKGNFEDSYIILKSIDDSKLRGAQVLAYYNDLLYCLLLKGNIDDAKELYIVNSYIYKNAINNKKISNALKDTIATYNYFLGDIEQSEHFFNDIIDTEKERVSLASKYYFLGLINKDKGNTTKAIEYLQKVCSYAPNSYFQIKAIEHIKEYKEESI